MIPNPHSRPTHLSGPLARLLLAALLLTGVPVAPSAGASPRPEENLAEALLRLEAGTGGTVRVLHFGDSHVAGDHESSVIRGYLAGLFGDGGPGHLLPWSPPRGYGRSGVSTGSTPGWRRILPSRQGGPDDAGLSGCSMEAEGSGQKAWALAPFDRLRLYCLRQPGGGSAEVSVDGAPLGRVELASKLTGVVVLARDLPASTVSRRVEIRTGGPGKVRILGLTLERGTGLTYSPLGVLGARADLLLRNRPETFARLLRAEEPDLVVLGYGTNEAGDLPFDEGAYATTFAEVLARVRRDAPGASILVLGPPDRARQEGATWRSLGSLEAVARAQRDACRRVGATFLDLRAIMGGDGAAQRWATSLPPLAQADRVHFTREGYGLLGRSVAKAVLEGFDRTKTSSGFRERLRRESDAETLLALASKPASLPGEPAVSLALAAYPAEPAEETHEVYYFRDARGVLVITDDPSYGDGSGSGPHPRREEEAPTSGVYYFERPDGTLVVTSDPEAFKDQPGKLLTPDEVRARPARGAPKGPGR